MFTNTRKFKIAAGIDISNWGIGFSVELTSTWFVNFQLGPAFLTVGHNQNFRGI